MAHGWGPGLAGFRHGIYSLPPAYSGGESAMTAPCFRISGQDGIHPLITVRSPSSSTHQADPEFVMRISPRSTTAGLGVSRRTASFMPSGPVLQYASTPCCRWDLEGNPDSSREQQQQQQRGHANGRFSHAVRRMTCTQARSSEADSSSPVQLPCRFQGMWCCAF